MSGCTGEVVVGVGVIGIEYVCAEDDSGSEASEEEDLVELGDQASAARYALLAEGQRQAKAVVRLCHSGQRLVWGYKSDIGCTPESCLQACDRSACCCATDGCVTRWAAAHLARAPRAQALTVWSSVFSATWPGVIPTLGNGGARQGVPSWGQCGLTISVWHSLCEGTRDADSLRRFKRVLSDLPGIFASSLA